MSEIQTIAISKISLSGWNPRGEESYKGEKFEELVQSIKNTGFWISKALLVRPFDGGYQLIAGHRRLRAAQEVGLKEVPVMIEELDDREAKIKLFLDNFHHQDFEALEEAGMIRDLLGEGITQDSLGKKMGKSQGYIANRLRLLKAPDELKDLIISRKITPGHVMLLLPVIEYSVYKESIFPVIKKEVGVGEISIKRLESVIEQSITNDHSGEFVFRLDELDWQYRDFKKYLDMPGCAKKCIHVRQYNRFGGTEIYCLNRKCWSDKINVAKQKFEKANAVQVKKLGDKKTVDTSKLGYGKYGYLHPSNFDHGFDKAECVACESCKKDKRDLKQLICIDVACYKKKERALNKEKNKKARDENETVFAAMDKLLLDIKVLGEKELRFLAMRLGNHIIWSQAVKKAFKPWEGLAKGDAKLPAIKDIPAEDLPRLLLRLVIIQEMNGGNGTATMERFRSAVEGLAPSRK